VFPFVGRSNENTDGVNPLLIYKGEAYKLFKAMAGELNREVTSFLFTSTIPIQDPEEVREARQRKKTDMSQMQTSRNTEEGAASSDGANKQSKLSTNGESAKPRTYKRSMPKVGRNDACPCGSGKKYKHCHGKKQSVN